MQPGIEMKEKTQSLMHFLRATKTPQIGAEVGNDATPDIRSGAAAWIQLDSCLVVTMKNPKCYYLSQPAAEFGMMSEFDMY